MSALLDVIEAVYRVEQPVHDYLYGVAIAGTKAFGSEGAFAYTFDASKHGALSVDAIATHDFPDEWLQMFRGPIGLLDDAYLSATYRRTQAGLLTRVPGALTPMLRKILAASSVADCFAVNGCDATFRGLWVGAAFRRKPSLTSGARWTRLASHLATGGRLQRKLAAAEKPDVTVDADALLSPSGKVLHAVRDAEASDARRDLADAVTRLERARGPLGRKDEDAAIAAWRGLVSARWSLVDHFESDGKRLVVATENASKPHALATLSPRERQVVVYAAMGHSNKLIGYELGVAASTAGVLLHRAMKKLGVTTRAELAMYGAPTKTGA